jgi:hypothetical protein
MFLFARLRKYENEGKISGFGRELRIIMTNNTFQCQSGYVI